MTQVEEIIRIFLALFFFGIGVFYSVRLLTFRASAPRLFLGPRGSSHWLGHVAFRAFRLTILVVCVLRVFVPQVDDYLGLFPIAYPAVLISGVLLMLAGFVVSLKGHYDLGEHWRSGIDPYGPHVIVNSGLYARTRNPMYIGVLMGQIGFFLALPSVFTLVCLVVGALAIFNQVRLEEAHLARLAPGEYLVYSQRVRRWF